LGSTGRKIDGQGRPGRKCETLSENKLEKKRAGDVAQVEKSLPKKHKALCSNTSTAKLYELVATVVVNAVLS
jgi:hypothetical protein